MSSVLALVTCYFLPPVVKETLYTDGKPAKVSNIGRRFNKSLRCLTRDLSTIRSFGVPGSPPIRSRRCQHRNMTSEQSGNLPKINIRASSYK